MRTIKQEGSPMEKWRKVEEELPTKEGQHCWVWCPEMGNVDEDTWEGDRGEEGCWANGPEEDREFIKSGWYTYTAYKITHWMPIIKPEKPE